MGPLDHILGKRGSQARSNHWDVEPAGEYIALLMRALGYQARNFATWEGQPFGPKGTNVFRIYVSDNWEYKPWGP